MWVLYVTSSLMAFTLHHPKVMLRVLVTVLHLDRVAGDLRLVSPCEIAFICLACVATVGAPQLLPLLWPHSQVLLHGVPL
jgi:hypothetical protein